MIELTNNACEISKISGEILQLRHLKGESVFMTDPEGNKVEFKIVEDGTSIVFTRDENGKSIAIEERPNGTRLYHISKDNTGLPSSHEIRTDETQVVYFYNSFGNLQHFVELKPNGDRISTVISDNGSIYSMEQKQIGGIIFQAWINSKFGPKEGMIWLHSDGEVSTHGDKAVVSELFSKFSRFLDGVRV